MKPFKSLLEFQKYFNTDEKCRKYLEEQRWGGSPACPHCGSVNVCRFQTDKRIFKCRECRKKFSVTVGTFYENTKIPLTKWFLAQYILCVHSKGISSLQLANMLDVTQKTAWFLNHRIRAMFTNRKSELLQGVVEVDETYVGGKDKNRHKSKKKGSAGKTMVVGAVQRGGIVKAKVIPAATTENVSEFIADNIQENTNMVTDESHIYKKAHLKYLHDKVNHTEKEYVRGTVHTNTIEGFWNLLKKQVSGIHHSVSSKHLQRYTNECAYRYNQRGFTQDVRFAYAMTMCDGRLRYKDLIAASG